MKRFALCLTRGLLLVLSIGFFGALVLTALPAIVQAQDAPAADCDSGPNVACPAPDDPSARVHRLGDRGAGRRHHFADRRRA